MQYGQGDQVMLWVNKVGPYNNPQETYNYYSLPFCSPGVAGNARHKWGGLGEVLEGNELIDSQIEIKFNSKCCVGSFSFDSRVNNRISCLIEFLCTVTRLSSFILLHVELRRF